jgi:hypothetical protein
MQKVAESHVRDEGSDWEISFPRQLIGHLQYFCCLFLIYLFGPVCFLIKLNSILNVWRISKWEFINLCSFLLNSAISFWFDTCAQFSVFFSFSFSLVFEQPCPDIRFLPGISGVPGYKLPSTSDTLNVSHLWGFSIFFPLPFTPAIPQRAHSSL